MIDPVARAAVEIRPVDAGGRGEKGHSSVLRAPSDPWSSGAAGRFSTVAGVVEPVIS
jgi:hypothetical protein